MNFDDHHMIDQTMKTHNCEVEVMYWMVEDAIYKGDIDKAKMMMNMLLYIGKYKPQLIQSGLQAVQRMRIKQILHEIYENISIQQHKSIKMKPPIQPNVIPFKFEKELQTYLVQHKYVLENILSENLSIIGTEVEINDEYRCDIVVESLKKCYVIELKIAQSTHAVVSQCSKYCYHFYRELRYDRFKEIQGVIISNGFDAWAVNAIRQEGHWIFAIISTDDSNIKLERID